MKLIIVRHGQTNFNLERKLQGVTDNELNDNGKNQAEQTKEKLENETFDLILCSPLIRARQTADIINKERKVKIKKILEQVNLTKERNTTFKHLSGGMKRRLGIAQALLNDPKVLIVDEPTVGLDPEERIRFHNLLTELANSRIVLLSTHIVSDIETTCNNLAILHEGKVLFSGNAKKLKEKAQNKVFIIEVEKEKINKIKEKYKVINMIQEDNKIKCRIVSLITPKEKHTVVTPTIEDGYMYILESEKK